MSKSVILIGVGEIGGVFAKGILRTGFPVYPVVRGADMNIVAKEVPDPQAVVVAVGEKDIHQVLKSAPQSWHDRLVLVQNELLPRDWNTHNIARPTVISVWFEKKPGQDAKAIISSPVYGPLSSLIQSSLQSIDIDCHILSNADELLHELVLKNVYILTVNIAGLQTGGTVGELWERHQTLARDVAGDVMDIQFCLVEKELDRSKLVDGMVRAFNGDLNHKCMGRSAPVRLERAIAWGDEFGLEIKTLREIYRQRVESSAKQ